MRPGEYKKPLPRQKRRKKQPRARRKSRHSAYLDEDRKQKNNIDVLPTLGEYFSERNAYIQFKD